MYVYGILSPSVTALILVCLLLELHIAVSFVQYLTAHLTCNVTGLAVISAIIPSSYHSQHYAIHPPPDPRVSDWPLMQSPFPTYALCSGYVVMCGVGPYIMMKREPFRIRPLLVVYNIALIILSLYMCSEVAVHVFVLSKIKTGSLYWIITQYIITKSKKCIQLSLPQCITKDTSCQHWAM